MTTGQLSKAGAGFSAAHEAGYLYAYPDPGTGGDPWTIGFGHTAAAGAPVVRRGDRITLQRAFEIYAADMGRVERDVRGAIKPQLTQPQFDATCSFHLNTGAVRAGSIDDKLNRGDEAGALATWSQYINAGGKPLNGLIRRRREEIALWKTGIYPASKILIRDTPTGSGRYISTASIPWRGESSPASPPPIAADLPAPVIVKSPVPAQPARPVDPWYVRLGRWFLEGWMI
jgi:GH24 family phage-related lysozyme (muramidase)